MDEYDDNYVVITLIEPGVDDRKIKYKNVHRTVGQGDVFTVTLDSEYGHTISYPWDNIYSIEEYGLSDP